RQQPGHGPHVGRSVATLVGFNQQRITREVYEGAIGQIRQQTEQGAREETAERTARAEAQLNTQAARFLIGYDTIAVGSIALTNADLRSQPTHVFAQGTLTWRGVPGQLGADFPQPPQFEVPEAGVTADVHLTSALSNAARG